jgi:hypothetical protein
MSDSRATHFPSPGLFFPLAPCLGSLIVTPSPGLGENTCLLHFAVKLTQGGLKRTIGVNNNLTHLAYQRDLLLER